MGGDEEDDAGIDKYNRYTDAKDSRLFHVGTASGSYVNNRNASLSRTVVVLEATGLKEVRNPQPSTQSNRDYDLSGRPATRQSRLIIKDGKKIMNYKH